MPLRKLFIIIWDRYYKTKKYGKINFLKFILIIMLLINFKVKRDKVIVSIFAGRKKNLEITYDISKIFII